MSVACLHEEEKPNLLDVLDDYAFFLIASKLKAPHEVETLAQTSPYTFLRLLRSGIRVPVSLDAPTAGMFAFISAVRGDTLASIAPPPTPKSAPVTPKGSRTPRGRPIPQSAGASGASLSFPSSPVPSSVFTSPLFPAPQHRLILQQGHEILLKLTIESMEAGFKSFVSNLRMQSIFQRLEAEQKRVNHLERKFAALRCTEHPDVPVRTSTSTSTRRSALSVMIRASDMGPTGSDSADSHSDWPGPVTAPLLSDDAESESPRTPRASSVAAFGRRNAGAQWHGGLTRLTRSPRERRSGSEVRSSASAAGARSQSQSLAFRRGMGVTPMEIPS